MIKIMLSLFLIFSFTAASFGNCNEINCAEESNQTLSSACNQSSHSSKPESNDQDTDHSHCAFHCNHTVNASIPVSALKLPIEAPEQIKANYLFAYQDPTLDSIERPPLS